MIRLGSGGTLEKLFDLLQRRTWLGPLILFLAMGVGMVLGLLIGWVVAPVNWTMSTDDVQVIADSYALNNDLTLARGRLQALTRDEQARLLNRTIVEKTGRQQLNEADRVKVLAQALGLPTDSTPPPPPPVVPSGNSLVSLLVLGAIFLVALGIAGGGFLFVRRVLPHLRAARPSIREEFEELHSEQPLAPVAAPQGSLGRYIATYNAGVDNFDVSFPLETARQGFLGECGIGVSETIGEGLPDKVTAFDLWLFDKTDVRTVTQILMSEYAFSDEGLRGKLETKGETVLAVKDRVLRLETQSLRLEAEIQELAYATHPDMPPNSYFQRLVVEMASYTK